MSQPDVTLPTDEQARISHKLRRQTRRRHEILRVSARLFAEYGYERTTLDMIAEELGLSKPSLYYYVKNKEDVLSHIFQDIFQHVLERAELDITAQMGPVERLQHLIVAYVTHACIYPEGRALFLYESHLLSVCEPSLVDLRDRYQRLVEAAVAEGIRVGVFHVAHEHLAALAVIGALHAIPLWYTPDGPLSPSEIAQQYARLLIGGMIAPLDTASEQ
ncbi:MAG: TetR/AcrR family transcriptional regulator [Ktedonobacterales bacterium]